MSVKEITTKMNRLLEPTGFSRRGKAWNRKTQSFVDVIDLQKSKSNDMVTITAGVLDRQVSAMLENREPSEFAQQTMCTVGVRIGELADGRDKWWQIDGVGVADEIADSIATRILPFLERMHTREAMKHWLVSANVSKRRYPPPIINLAILEYLLGDPAKGCAILADLQKMTPSGGWRMRAAEVAARLGCTPQI
jgi:hypothetical protein